jgi:hypothetical protein
VNYLFQLYCPLTALCDVFTHYDLHTSNVLIYNLSSDESKYIQLIYHYPKGETVELNTFGIAKIIDYGRSFFDDKKANVSSKTIMKKVQDAKKTPSCRPNGLRSGYLYINNESTKGINSYICSNKKNITHDLRFAKIVNSHLDYQKIREEKVSKVISDNNLDPIKKILQSVHKNYMNQYSLKHEKKDEGYGAPEYKEHEYNVSKQVRNVKDMHVALKELILKQPYFKDKMNTLFQGKKKMGTMHIYVDGSKPTEYKQEV